jgi:hypothetical protein
LRGFLGVLSAWVVDGNVTGLCAFLAYVQ